MSNKPNYKTARKYKCPYCDLRATRVDLVDHIEKVHHDLIPEDYTAARVIYDAINGKNYGTCMICKCKVYEWNDKINRYYNLCKKPECKNKVREIALDRHMKVYNKPTLLNDAEHQEKMLANRRISGTYAFSDGKKFVYTGKYERNALEFMDKVLGIPSSDILTPGPVLEYEYEGETHKWITDILYIPANLIIEIKDGGNNPNTRTMTSYRDKQIAKEVMITDKGTYNYIRLTNNNFAQLLDIFADMKNGALNNDTKARIHINESIKLRTLINESKSCIDKNFKSKGQLKLSSLNRIHITEDIIDKYKKEYPCLKHVRCKDTKEYVCDGYMWMDNDKLVCVVGSCKYKDDLTKWIVSLEVMPEYKGYGLSKQILDYAVKSMNCKYLSVNKNNEVAKYVYDNYGFKVYQESDSMYYMCYGTPDNILKEEVGGLPPHRPPEAYIVPYGMNNVFDGYAYTDSDMDKMITIDDDGHILPMIESVFYETFTTGPALYYNKSDIANRIKKIHEAIGDNGKFGKYEIVGHLFDTPINKPEDVFLSDNFNYYDKALEEQTLKLLENGVAVKINGNTDIIETIGNVFIHISPNGYYATTPEDFYLASAYFEDKESLDASGIVDTMNNIYASNSKTKGEISDV